MFKFWIVGKIGRWKTFQASNCSLDSLQTRNDQNRFGPFVCRDQKSASTSHEIVISLSVCCLQRLDKNVVIFSCNRINLQSDGSDPLPVCCRVKLPPIQKSLWQTALDEWMGWSVHFTSNKAAAAQLELFFYQSLIKTSNLKRLNVQADFRQQGETLG